MRASTKRENVKKCFSLVDVDVGFRVCSGRMSGSGGTVRSIASINLGLSAIALTVTNAGSFLGNTLHADALFLDMRCHYPLFSAVSPFTILRSPDFVV